MGNREAKKLICMTHGHELSSGVNAGGRGGEGWRGIKPGNGATLIAKSIKYIKKRKNMYR